MLQTQITVATSANRPVKTTWGVAQIVPRLSLVKQVPRGDLIWMGDSERLLPEPFARPAYQCYLLRDDIDLTNAEPAAYWYAGAAGERDQFNPGSLVHRNKDLGVVNFRIANGFIVPGFINVRTWDGPSATELKWLTRELEHPLWEFIKAHKAKLHTDALRELKDAGLNTLHRYTDLLEQADVEFTLAMERLMLPTDSTKEVAA